MSAPTGNEILHSRAEQLAKSIASEELVIDDLEVIEFVLGNESYALELKYVREVYPVKEITPLPGVPSFVLGILNIRRKILSVISLKKVLGLPESEKQHFSKIIILYLEEMEFGIGVEAIMGIRSIPLSEIQYNVTSFNGDGQKYLKGITKTPLIILDGNRLLTEKSIIVSA